MNIFRQFRWQLTLSYTLVTDCALQVITHIREATIFKIFIPNNYLSPAGLVSIFRDNSTPLILATQFFLQPRTYQRIMSDRYRGRR